MGAHSRLYVPVRLLSEKYDIPQPYTLAPRSHTETLLAAYDTTTKATACITAALDDLAASIDAPSSMLAATRQALPVTQREAPAHRDQRPACEPPDVTPVTGAAELALRDLQIRDPALLLRAAVIDHAARDLVSEATAKANSRATVTIPVRMRPAPGRRLTRPRG